MRMFKSFAARLAKQYRRMSIQMVISLSFTAVAVVGMVFMGLSLFWRFSADRKSTRLNSSHSDRSRMPSSA